MEIVDGAVEKVVYKDPNYVGSDRFPKEMFPIDYVVYEDSTNYKFNTKNNVAGENEYAVFTGPKELLELVMKK